MTCIKFDGAALKEDGNAGLPNIFTIKSDACFEPPLSLIMLDVSISNPR
jgi:hypothetical protein